MKKTALVFIFLLLAGCANYRVGGPKYPYPYSYHEDNKTCEYYSYHKFWGEQNTSIARPDETQFFLKWR